MRKLTPQDINSLVRKSLTKIMLEKLTVKIGDEIVIAPNLKIKHVGNRDTPGSNLLYTVNDIKNVDGVLQMSLRYYDDNSPEPIETTVTQDEFDQYGLA